MGCDRINDEQGRPIGFACSRGRHARKLCDDCGNRPVTKLCDFPLTGSKVGQTCDRGMCGACASHVGPDRDYCRAHAQQEIELARAIHGEANGLARRTPEEAMEPRAERRTKVAKGTPLAGAKCRSCGARILWTETETGKRMPVDFDPVDNGNVVIAPDEAAGLWRSRYVKAAERDASGLVVRLSHFVTCPDAKAHRKGRR